MRSIRRLIVLIAIGVAIWFVIMSQSGIRPGGAPSITIPPARPSDDAVVKIDRVFIDKSERRLVLYANGRAVKSYAVALGFAPEGQKRKEGDGKTPTGNYVIDYRNPQSSFYRSLHISYPRPDQVAAARAEGRNPGGMIMIHGQPNGSGITGNRKIGYDWTAGCVSVSNNEMDEIWRLVSDGTPIEIIE